MDRTSGTNYTTDGDGNRIFTNGPPGTRVEEDFLNGVQEEIVGMIEETGQTPSDTDNTQLKQAIMSGLSSVFTPSVRLVWKDTDTITVQAGWYFVGGTYIRQLAANLDWTWVASGQNRGLLGGGPEANSTWYYLYGVLYNDAFAVVADDNTPPTARFNTAIMPLVPTHSYNTNIYLGAFYNGAAGNILLFSQDKNRFLLDKELSENTTTSDVYQAKALGLPDSASHAIIKFFMTSASDASGDVNFSSFLSVNNSDAFAFVRCYASYINNYSDNVFLEVPLITADTVYIKSIKNHANQVAYVQAMGWVDKYL